MAFNIAYTFKALDKFSAVSNKISANLSRLLDKVSLLQARFMSVGRGMSDLGRRMALSVSAPLVGIGVAALKSSDDLAELHNKLSTVGDTAQQAQRFFKQLVDFTVRSPFNLDPVASAAHTLRVMGFSANEAMTALNYLGNIAAAKTVDLGMLTETLGRAKASSKGLSLMFTTLGGMGIDLRGVIQDMLAEIGAGNLDVDKLVTSGKIGFPVIMLALKRLTTGTGVFAGQMQKLALTAGKSLGSLKTAIQVYVLAPMGDMLDKTLGITRRLQFLINYLIQNQVRVKLFLEAHKQTIKLLAAIAAVTAVLAPVLIMLGLFVMTVSALFSPWLLVIGAIAMYFGFMAKAYLKTHTFQQLVSLLITKFKAWYTTVTNFITAHQKLLAILGKITIGLIAFLAVAKGLSLVLTTLQAIISVLRVVAVIGALLVSPIVFAVVVVGVFIAAVVVLYKKFALVRAIINTLGKIFLVVVKTIGKILYDSLIKPFETIYHVIKGISNLFHRRTAAIQIQHQMVPPPVGKVQPAQPISTATAIQQQKVRSELYVNLSDPGRLVSGWKGRSDGYMKFNVGTNMALSR